MGKWVHRLSDINPDLRTATCAECGPASRIVYRAHRSQWACRASQINRSPESLARRRRKGNLMYRFQMTLSDYDALLLAQGGHCAICQQVCSTGRRLAVDHEHASGAVRGLLCNHCNRGLGLFHDDPIRLQRAAGYLTK